MKKRTKKYNAAAVNERACRALMRTEKVAVINLEPGDRQWMVHWRTGKMIGNRHVADVLTSIAHRWSVFAAVLCERPDGERYLKSSGFVTDGIHMATGLEDEIQGTIQAVLETCNPNHVVCRAWIAIPDDVDLEEAQAGFLFERFSGWARESAAA